MKHLASRNVVLLCVCLPTDIGSRLSAQPAFNTLGNFNPIVPGYFADPTIKQFGNTFYLYATTDGNGGGRGPATAWVSSDFVNWVLVPMNWPGTPFYWAPDVIQRPDGRFYLFYNQPCNTYAGVSDSPIGPWTPLTPGEGLVIPDRLVKDVITLDTQLFPDKDGSLYGYWGTWGIFPNSGCGIGVFNPDMKSFSRLSMIPNTQARDFFEAPFMIERNGVYYFTYSSGSCHDASYRVQYAVGSRPDGEFKMGPNNPILETSSDRTIHGPGHHSILQQGNDYYIVYHRHDLPLTPNGMHRQTCADRLVFGTDGVIEKVAPTHSGVGFLGPKSAGPNLAFGRPATSSSHYQDTLRNHTYRPDYAVDDNNATLWRPADNGMGHWLQVDLGTLQRVRQTEVQFEYATWYYQYLIEYSSDATEWQVFADRRQNTRWGSPMVDTGNIEARFLRLTVTGVEYPGLFGAIWNFKAFADAPANPLFAMADRAFADCVAPTQKKHADRALPTGPGTTTNDQPLIRIESAELRLGQLLASVKNAGSLGGEFVSSDTPPVVGMASGCKAIRFSGKQLLTASFPAPPELSGNRSFTVAMWVNNPDIAESECVLSWAGRGGPDAATAQFGYGTQRDFGAVGHWGFADMGFRGAPPPAGEWQHIAIAFDGVVERVYVNGELNNAEAKMLLVHTGRPVYLGASEPGTEFYDGYLESLCVYGRALSAGEVGELARKRPSSDVLVHADAARLDYGPLTAWTNSGSARGAFVAKGAPPVVAEVNKRIAITFAPGQALELDLPAVQRSPNLTVLVSLAEAGIQGGLELISSAGAATRLLPALPPGAWNQVAVVYNGRESKMFINGKVSQAVASALPSGVIARVRFGGENFSGAIARLQLFARALPDDEIAQLHAAWTKESRLPSPSPAQFSRPPAALTSSSVGMAAQVGNSALGALEYLFSEVSKPGARTSGWRALPYFLAEGLQPNTRYVYTVAMRDPLGNVSASSSPVEVLTDPHQFQEFSADFADRDYLTAISGSGWDGVLKQSEGSQPEAVIAHHGKLRLQSKGTVWDGGKPLGAFVYKNIQGDFVAEATVSDYAGLAERRTPGNTDGGLMVRVASIADAGPGEDLVQLNFFPIWGQGNMHTSLGANGRSQRGNGLAWDAHRYLRIIRQGPLFYFRTSADGRVWQDIPGSPVERKDMDGLPLQVGLYHASYGGESSYIEFGAFRLMSRVPRPGQ